jgi:glucose/arabinose dehydrogenase
MRQTHTITLGAVVLAVAGAVAQTNERPVNWKGLPEPMHTPSVRNNPELVPKPEGAKLQLPPGFVVQEYMSGFVRPRFMLLGPGNEILLSDSGSRDATDGSVYVIKDGAKTAIIEKLDRPYGLALSGEWLYVAEPTSVKRYRYDAKTMRVNGAGQEIVSLAGMGTGHWTRSLLFNRDRSKLYVTVGSGSNIEMGEPAMRAALHRFNPDGTGHETVATGLRNTIGLRWFPGTDDLWGAVQERDGLGDDLVPDYLVKIRQGGFYGWPIAYTGPHQEPRHKDVDQAKVKSTLYPDVLLGAHVAVLDILFYTGQQFPAKYRNGLFLAFHGSWNRSQRVGQSITFIPFKDRKPTAGPEDFLTGWMLGPDKKEVWGRPVGLLQMPDGSLLITDDGGKKIWKVSYSGAAATSQAARTQF